MADVTLESILNTPGGIAGLDGSGQILDGVLLSVLDGEGAAPQSIRKRAMQVVTPFDFGAVGDGVADDTEAVQNFWNYVATTSVVAAHFTGKFLTSDTILVSGGSETSIATRTVVCDATLVVRMVLSDMKPAMKFERVMYCSFPGSINLIGFAKAFADAHLRTMFNGFEYGYYCTNASFGTFRVQWAYKWAHYRKEGSGGQVVMNAAIAERCGCSNVASEEVPGTFTLLTHSHNGLTGSAERSTVTLDRALPLGFDDECYLLTVDTSPHGSKAYQVTNVISPTEVEVFPRMDADFALNPSIRIAFGGNVYQEGPGFGLWTFLVVNSSSVGIPWADRCLYGSVVGQMHSAQMVMGGVLGSAPSAPVFGGVISKIYTEGNAVLRGILCFSASLDYTIVEASIFSREDTYRALSNSGAAYKKGSFGGYIASPAGHGLPTGSPVGNVGAGTVAVDATAKGMSIQTLFQGSGSTVAVELQTPDAAMVRDGRTTVVFFAASALGSASSGTWTVKSRNAEATVEGGVSKVVPSATGLRMVACMYDPGANDWKVHTFAAAQ